MMLLKAFLVGGALCMVGQVLVDRTRLTPARILSGYVVAGVVLSALGLTPRIESDGNSMWGKASVNNNTLVIQGDDENWSQVPDLTGMGARDALYALELRGMKATIRGCGKVVEQSIKPGTDVRRGATVKIKLG